MPPRVACLQCPSLSPSVNTLAAHSVPPRASAGPPAVSLSRSLHPPPAPSLPPSLPAPHFPGPASYPPAVWQLVLLPSMKPGMGHCISSWASGYCWLSWGTTDELGAWQARTWALHGCWREDGWPRCSLSPSSARPVPLQGPAVVGTVAAPGPCFTPGQTGPGLLRNLGEGGGSTETVAKRGECIPSSTGLALATGPPHPSLALSPWRGQRALWRLWRVLPHPRLRVAHAHDEIEAGPMRRSVAHSCWAAVARPYSGAWARPWPGRPARWGAPRGSG